MFPNKLHYYLQYSEIELWGSPKNKTFKLNNIHLQIHIFSSCILNEGF